ncbi:DNA polymerase III subunit beta [Moorella naiadis]|uniref:DNA polymerase III subunit beta n=1 Tax=Moorella naiadis (nom. illeg.) TaxID=3093670 RepID=UPI003D9CB5A6
MQVTCKQKDLALGLQKVSRALATTTTMPVLTGVLVEAQKDGLYLTATDLMLTIKTRVPAEVAKEGKMVLPGKIATELIRKIDAEHLIIVYNDPICRFVYGKNKVELNTYIPDSYPAAPEVDGIEFKVEARKLREAVSMVVVAAARDIAGAIFSNILLELQPGTLKLVATDSHRLAIKPISVQYEGEGKNCLAPAKQLYDLVRLFDDEDLNVTMEDSFIKFATETETAFIRLSAGKFPNYEVVIPKLQAAKITVKRTLLLDSLERASLFISEKRVPIVKIAVNGEVRLATYGSDIGGVNEIIEADTEGEAFEMTYNANLLLDTVRVVNSDELILTFSEKMKPLKLEPPSEDALHLVLPVWIGSEQ